jgi:CDP-glucose 4,6-dehydratase
MNWLKFFSGKKILITGHTGFKGSWLTLWLVNLGAEVIGYSLEPPTKPNLFEILRLEKEITHIIGDVRDGEKLKNVFKKYKPEIVFHLAAQPLVRVSYKEPKLTYETNVMGTLNLLEAVRETESVKVVIVVTTDKCYENKEWFYGYREVDPLGGYDPYSSSKACVEILVSSYRNSFQLPVATVRAGNVIGGGDWQVDRLIPDCVKALSKGETIKIRNPDAIRPWQHVLEPLYGYLLLAVKMWKEPERFCEAWNFGPYEKDTATVREVVEKVIRLWGKGSYEVIEDRSFHEAGLLRLDISKTMLKLGWRPKWNLDKALEKTVKWYKRFYEGKTDMVKYSIKEIEDYFSFRGE